IEAESGTDTHGPALVVTLAGKGGRYKLPDFGIGVTSLPSPERVSLAMELVPQGWLVRGNITFASEAAAAAFVQSMPTVRQRLDDARVVARRYVVDDHDARRRRRTARAAVGAARARRRARSRVRRSPARRAARGRHDDRRRRVRQRDVRRPELRRDVDAAAAH